MARDSRAAQRGTQKVRESDAPVVWSDEQLLSQFLSRTDETAEAAFTTLIERHGPIVHRVCLDVLRGPEEAQDAAQAVFLILAIKAGSIRKPEALGPWLHGVSLRVARRARLELARRRTAERKQAEMKHRGQIVEPEPDSLAFADLHEELDRLPDKYREPIILCYMQGLTQAEAADVLGWPLGTVQIRLHRGREKLRSRLARQNSASVYLSGSSLMAMLVSKPKLPGQEWTESTAHAAKHFACGQATAGLITPDVTCMAESALAAMLHDRWKPAAWAAAVIPLIAIVLWVGTLATPVEPSRLPTAEVKAWEVVQERVLPIVRDVERPVVTAAPIAPEPTRRQPVINHPEASAPDKKSPGLMVTQADPKPEPKPISGRELFERVWSRDDARSHGGDGLGPVFNGSSCAACHHLGGPGGAGGLERNIDIATVGDNTPEGNGYFYSFNMDFGAGRFEYRFGDPSTTTPSTSRTRPQLSVDPALLVSIHPGFRESRSVVLHQFGTDPNYNTWRGSVPGLHGMIKVQMSQRNSPALFGAGLIDSIPDAAIEAGVKRKSSSASNVRGRVSRLKDGRIGRFGWKAQTATLKEFVLSAASGEMGLEVPGRHQAADPRLPGIEASAFDMDQAECDALTEFVRSLPAPVRSEPVDGQEAAQIKTGEETFKTIGCAQCHVPKLGNVDGIYSDLLLHEMSPRLADSENYAVFVGDAPRDDRADGADRGKANSGMATSQEWRTPPLWGLRDSAPYLHDGRAATIEEAIALHAVQGASAAKRFAELSPKRKRSLVAFLNALAAPTANAAK